MKNGNAYFNDLSVYGGTISGPNYTIDSSGISFYDGSGNLIGQWLWDSGIQMYLPGGGGHLVASMSPTNTTDQFGNPIFLGYMVGQSGQVQIGFGLIGSYSGQLAVDFNNASFLNANMAGQLVSSDTVAQLYINGSANTATGHTDYVGMELNSSNGTSSANLEFVYTDANGASHEQAYLDYTGFQLRACLATGIQPGTGTSPTNAAVAETWHNLTLSGWGVTTGGYHAMYRMLPTGDVQLSGRITSTGTSATIATLPSGYYQTGSPSLSVPLALLSSTAVTAGQSPRIALSNTGVISVAGYTMASGNAVSLDGVIFPVSAG
jgi:hypothetical protein